jgi:hypothetical protein
MVADELRRQEKQEREEKVEEFQDSQGPGLRIESGLLPRVILEEQEILLVEKKLLEKGADESRHDQKIDVVGRQRAQPPSNVKPVQVFEL